MRNTSFEFKSFVKFSTDKKKNELGKNKGKKLFVDESRLWSFTKKPQAGKTLKRLKYLKHLKYLGNVKSVTCELERVLYIYKSDSKTLHTFPDSELNWNYSGKYSIAMGLMVRGFTFAFQT